MMGSAVSNGGVEQPEQKKPFSIAIVGGGLGGLSLAIGLLRHKVPVQIYESAREFSEIGAGVAFGPNTLRAISLIDPGLQAGYEKCATRNGWEERKKFWLTMRLGCEVPNPEDSRNPFPPGTLLCETEAGDVGQCSVHRAKFLDELVKLIPATISHFRKHLVDVKQEQRRVTLFFEDGSTVEDSAVVGCDGIKSRVRKVLLGPSHPFSEPVFAHEYAFRGLVPMEKAVEILGDYAARNGHVYFGYGGYIVTYPLDKHESLNFVAVREKEDGIWEYDEWIVESSRDVLLKEHEGWDPKILSLLRCIEKPQMWALHDQGKAPSYCAGKICLLGDAAHATTPNQGAGAGMAIEDAYVLSEILGHTRREEDLEIAFKAFDAVRRERTQRVVETSRQAGKLFALQEPGVRDDVQKLRKVLDNRLAWIWFENLEQEVDDALKFMGVL